MFGHMGRAIRAQVSAAGSCDGLFFSERLSSESVRDACEKLQHEFRDRIFSPAITLLVVPGSQRFLPRCVIVPVQPLDTGQVYSRAKLLVRGNMECYDQPDELVVDLFEPAVHIRVMPKAVQLRALSPRPTLKQIGAMLGTSYMTIKRALGYARLMQKIGARESYREVHDKPEYASRWRDAS